MSDRTTEVISCFFLLGIKGDRKNIFCNFVRKYSKCNTQLIKQAKGIKEKHPVQFSLFKYVKYLYEMKNMLIP